MGSRRLRCWISPLGLRPLFAINPTSFCYKSLLFCELLQVAIAICEEKRKEKIILSERWRLRKKHQERISQIFSNNIPLQPAKESYKPVKDVESYDKRRQEILKMINQQDTQARDSAGIRWVKCKICGLVDTSDKFVSYGGENHINLGICNLCGGRKTNDK